MHLTHFTEITDVKLELGNLNDAQKIARMSRELIEYGLGWSWTPPRVAQHIKHPRSLVLVARADNVILGFAITQYLRKAAHLDLLAVHPNYQRKGIGRSLISFLEHSAEAIGIDSVIVEMRASNIGGQSFYLTLGYQKLKMIPTYYRGKENAIRMIHLLENAAEPTSL